MDQYFDIVQNLYDIGIRNFLFLNLPPTWRTPLHISDGSIIQEELQQSVEIYNTQLHEKIGLFQRTYTVSRLINNIQSLYSFLTFISQDTRIYEFNTTAFFTKVLDDPLAYKFTSPVTTWCSNSTCFWKNLEHPSSWAHRFMAVEVAELLSQRGFW